MNRKVTFALVVGALVLVVAALAKLKVIEIPYPCQALKETAVLTVAMQAGACVVGRPEEIITQWEHAVTWTIAGEGCPDHTVSVGSFKFKDGKQLDPTEEPTKEAKAQPGQKIKVRVKDKDQAPKGKYTYEVVVRHDGQPAGGDPPGELRICPTWPCD
jgi:hypothetical protein